MPAIADELRATGPEILTECSRGFEPTLSRFAVGVNCGDCNDGTFIQVDRPTPECANVSPTPVPREPDRCLNNLRDITSQDVAAGYFVYWRWVTKGRNT